MNYLNDLGSLALGSRLKLLSERLVTEVGEIYRDQGIDFEPRWFSAFRFIAQSNGAAITDIAAAIGVTHPAVNQMAKELMDSGLIIAGGDPDDKRKRLLLLSAKGKQLKIQLEPIWKGIGIALSDTIEEAQTELVNALANFERALDRSALKRRFEELAPSVADGQVEIVDFEPQLASHFERLNKAWIEKYFRVEDEDRKLFAEPENIIKDGGAIFFARVGRRIVGTCALEKLDSTTYGLAKMAVDEAYQGLGIGRLLLDACINEARKRGATKVTLETNTRLKSAVKMYEKTGFRAVPCKGQSHFARVNLLMEMELRG